MRNARDLTNIPPQEPLALSKFEKAVSLGFALAIAGYAGLADIISCLFMVKPVRSEYHFEEGVTEEQWFIVALLIAITYGFYTFSAEGKSSYDTARSFFRNRHRRAALLAPRSIPDTAEFEFLIAGPERSSQSLPPQRMTCRQNLRYISVAIIARLVCLIGAAADSAETTMGLVEDGASMPKMIAISMLGFLGNIFFYGPFTIEAFEELFLGKIIDHEEQEPPLKIALVIGYPIAFFNAIQDTLECGAGLLDNFKITNPAGQWTLICLSSLSGISSLCLDGRIGVEILDHFFKHLKKNYAWIPDSLFHCQLPTPLRGLQLLQGAAGLGLALYAASYIAFADKELTFSLSQKILNTLSLSLPVLPSLLGWCIFLRDFVIQTKTYHHLEHLLISSLTQISPCLRVTRPAISETRQPEIELAVRSADENEEASERATLLVQNLSPRSPREAKPQSSWSRLFQHRTEDRRPNCTESNQTRLTCTIL